MPYLISLLLLAACATTALADEDPFTTGPVFTDYGPVADVDVTMRSDCAFADRKKLGSNSIQEKRVEPNYSVGR